MAFRSFSSAEPDRPRKPGMVPMNVSDSTMQINYEATKR